VEKKPMHVEKTSTELQKVFRSFYSSD